MERDKPKRLEIGLWTYGAVPTPLDSHGIKRCCEYCQLSSAKDCPVPTECHDMIGPGRHWEKIK